MRKLLMTFIAACALLTARADGMGPAATGGLIFGGVVGGLSGSHCHGGFSAPGAVIGAGFGFLAGTLVDEVHDRPCYSPAYYLAVPVASPGYGYVYAPAPGPVIVGPPPPPAPQSKAPVQSVLALPAKPVLQIPDAPRVPDAPTF